MASCSTPQWGNSYSPQVRLTLTQSSSDGGKVVYSWKLEYVAHSYSVSTSSSKSYTAVINGKTVASGTYAINGKTGTSTITSGSVTINKTTASQTINFSCSMVFNVTWNGTYGGTKSASGSLSVPAKSSYTVSYDANGGSGAPSNQTKWYNTNLTLSTSTPTRTGYSFKGWSTSSGGSVAYSPGSTYTGNAALTLYAVWSPYTYTVSYNANGGSGAPSSQTKTYGVNLTLSTTRPTRTNYTFLGWSTSSGGSVVYSPGSTYSGNANLTLYAVWSLSYVKPRITSHTAYRLDNKVDIYVKFNWATDYDVSYINVYWKTCSSTSWLGPTSLSASGKSGTATTTITDLDQDHSYDIRIKVGDSNGSTEITKVVAGAVYIMDVDSTGTGIAFGKAATVSKAMDVGYISYYRNHMRLDNGMGIFGKNSSGNYRVAFEPCTSSGNVSIGWGLYEASEGATNIYGNNINFTTKSGKVNFGSNKLISSGNSVLASTYFANDWFGLFGSHSDAVNYKNRKGWIGHNGSTNLTIQNEAGGACVIRAGATVMGGFRFASGWIGLYANTDNALNSASRKGWIGHDGSDNLTINNEAGGNTSFLGAAKCWFHSTTHFVYNVYFGESASNEYGIGSTFADGAKHNVITRGSNGLNCYFGWVGSSSYKSMAQIRGQTVQYRNSSGTSTLSDERLKEDFKSLDAWGKFYDTVEPIAFKMKNGNSGRYHIGFKAQQIEESLEKVGMTNKDFAGLIKAPYSPSEEDTDDIAFFESVGIKPGDTEYGIIYTEFIALNTYMIQKLQQEVKSLKEKISS